VYTSGFRLLYEWLLGGRQVEGKVELLNTATLRSDWTNTCACV
jgi:hypothetical protein